MFASFPVHTVAPVSEFDAHELTTPGVAIRVGTIRLPSTLTADTPVAVPDQLPLGTYETTSAPITSTESELEGWHEPWGGVASVDSLKLSVRERGWAKTRTLGSAAEIVASATGTSHALYTPPEFGVVVKGASCTGVTPLAALKVPLACLQAGPAAPTTRPPATDSWRHAAGSV